MSESVKKIPVLRYGIIVLLIGVSVACGFYFYAQNRRVPARHREVHQQLAEKENYWVIDSCLTTLYNTGNNNHLYAVTGNSAYLNPLVNQVNHLGTLLDNIQAEANTAADPVQLKALKTQKSVITKSFTRLRLNADSLVRISADINAKPVVGKVIIPARTIRTVIKEVKVDTIKPKEKAAAAKPPKKKFLGRLIASITQKIKAGHSPQQQPAKHKIITKTTVKDRVVYTHVPQKVRYYYKSRNINKNELRAREHEILLTNNRLVADMMVGLHRYKTAEQITAQPRTVNLHPAPVADKTTDIVKNYNLLPKLLGIVLILLGIALLRSIWKIFDDKRKYSEGNDISTPLNPVAGFSEQPDGPSLTPQPTAQINAFRNSARQLLAVMSPKIAPVKQDAGKIGFEKRPFILTSVLNDAYRTAIVTAAKKDVHLHKSFVFEEDTCFIGDASNLKRIVMSLLVNAIKCTNEDEVFLQVMLVQKTNKSAVLHVNIKGIGVPKSDLESRLNALPTVDVEKVAGLAICKKIIGLQNGKISAANEPGQGSVITFQLPFKFATKKDIVEQQAASDARLQQMVSGARVLLAEGNKLDVLLAQRILKKWNISCDMAGSAQEAFDLFEAKQYDMILTDMEMPEIGGTELVKKIRQYKPELKAGLYIIAMTGNLLKQCRDEYYKAGANDVLLKPVVEREMIEKIALALKSREMSHSNGEVLLSTGMGPAA